MTAVNAQLPVAAWQSTVDPVPLTGLKVRVPVIVATSVGTVPVQRDKVVVGNILLSSFATAATMPLIKLFASDKQAESADFFVYA